MPITYRKFLILLGLALPLTAVAQGLEEKASQSQRLQAQAAASGLDPQTVDSLVNERRNQEQGSSPDRRKLSSAAVRETVPSDSLLSGPSAYGEDSLDLYDTTAVAGNDSLGLNGKRHPPMRHRRVKIPPRYEQRIFRTTDRTAFGSTASGAGRDYILGAGDQVTVSLWGDREKESVLTLSPEGAIFLEGAGLVPLAGLSLGEAQLRVKSRLAKVFSGIARGTSHVAVSLGHAGPIKVFVLGEVKLPGGFVFSGNTSVMSAMYYAKGPSDIGTVRNLVLNRGGKKYPLDLYRYLIYGERLSPDALQDGDVLFSGRASILAEVSGDVGRAAVYELKKGEGVKEALEFAGGINATSASHRITLQRVFPDGRIDYLDLASPQDYASGKTKFELQDGDKLLVEKSTERSKAYYTIEGPVKYPGTYSSGAIRTVRQLVDKAGGLREDAYLGRVHVVRAYPNGSSSLFAFSLDSTGIESITLEPRDTVLLYSSRDMYLPDSVEISGAVFYPGRFEFREGMTAKDLVMMAGGYLPHHESGRLLVFRGDPHERRVTQMQLDVADGLAETKERFQLKPNDFLQVPIDPRWYQKEVVILNGHFVHPGKYALLFPGETLNSVITRAGGFKPDAYVSGARLFRSKDSVGRVGLDFNKALRNSNSKQNISLVGGDSIVVPERLNTVKVVGEVGFATSVLYKDGANVEYYIEKAGGFTRRSEKNHVVVEYANGETGGTGYFNRQPDAGSVIFVPQGPEPKPVDWFAGINAILGTLSIGLAVALSIAALSK
ncbi:MAG: SLBB domain-containing protein [Fibrobacteres bacterium]|nr:SLBB domain-containing protein [Fibrobacterota bacterium]